MTMTIMNFTIVYWILKKEIPRLTKVLLIVKFIIVIVMIAINTREVLAY